MDINLDLIKQIISSDELCAKVNSAVYKESYKRQIMKFVLYLCDDVKSNIVYINRYLKFFVIGDDLNKEDKFFDPVLLKSYSKHVLDSEYLSLLSSFGFDEIKELLMKKYDQFVQSNSSYDITRMLNFYKYACGDYILPNNYVDYIVREVVKSDFVFDYDLMVYFYRQFALSYASSRGININFSVCTEFVQNDPYYDNRKNGVIIYKHDITNKLNYNILASIFYQIKYLYVLKSINDPNNSCYSFEQLRLVKEISLISILGEVDFNNNYSHISFSNSLHRESFSTVANYLKKLGIDFNGFNDFIDIDFDSSIGSIDILFDQVINREGVNLLKSLIKNYPILACEYKSDKKKSLLNLLLDIYSNRKLLINLNKDLEWFKSKNDNEFSNAKVERLENKISICKSCIGVMNLIVNNGDMLLEDLLRSISDLILYDTNKPYVKNDIYSVLKVVVPRKIERLCSGHDPVYIENVRKKVIDCYLQSLNTVRNIFDMDYFMRLYSTLDVINIVFEKIKQVSL